jgi:transcriptional regulator with XRE-family HTH domain
MNQQVASKRAKGSCVCGQRLRDLRTSCGLTQVELARLAGYSERLIRKAESGGSLSLATIADLAEALSSHQRWVSPAELCCSHEALARLFVDSYDEHERLMLDYCRHILADDFVFHFAGEARSRLSGEWLRAAGLQAWLDEFFCLVTRPVRRCLQVSYLTDVNEVTARYSDALVAADQCCHTMWVNLHFTFRGGHIQRIVYQCDTSLVAKLAEYSNSTLGKVQALVAPYTYAQPVRLVSQPAPASEPAS